MPETIENLTLRLAQVGQINDQYRASIFISEQRFVLLTKMLEEKGLFVKDEFERRWPLYMKNNVGAIGADGVMEGTLRVNFYDK